MNTLLSDLRYGIRMLLKKPGFTLITVMTLAIGIGANTALFSVVNAVLLGPLPFRDPDRLVAVGQNSTKDRKGLFDTSYRNYVDWREQNGVFDEMAAYYGTSFILTGQGDAVRVLGTVVTHSLFDALKATPLLGRTFLPEDEKTNVARPAILSWDCWQQYLGGEPNVIGRSIRLDGEGYVVIGVMPSGFAFPIQTQPSQVWISPARFAGNTNQGSILVSRGFRVWKSIARLKPDVGLAQAQAEMNVIANNLASQFPEANRDAGITVAPLLDSLVGDVRLTLLLLFGAVGCVLLIVCINVANLLLERAIARKKEITIRLAVGASRWRVARQLLTESLVLASFGGAAGLLCAWWGKDLLVALSPEGIARITETRLDARVLMFTLLVSLLTGVLFGIAPALAASRTSLSGSLKEGGRGASEGRGVSGTRSLLVVFEVAVAVVLLVGGGLLVRSLMRLQRTGLGFNTERVLTFGLAISNEALGGGQNIGPQQHADFFRQVEERLKALPGVTGVSITFALPLSGGASATGLKIEGRTEEPGKVPMAVMQSVGVDYFRTLGIPLIKGREFTDHDDLSGSPVLMVNETLATRFFPNENPIGKHIEPSFSAVGATRPREIVGVVADTRFTGPRDEARPEIFFAAAQMPLDLMSVVMRTTGDPHAVANAARAEIHAFNKNVPVFRLRTLDEYYARSLAAPRFNTFLIGLFAAIALVITVVGLYGVISFGVSQRTHEFGIRVSLGAQAGDILRMVLSRGIKLSLIGIALGVAGSFALTRLLADMLYKVSTTDPLIFIVVPLIVLGVALGACFVPARRATKVDPLIALRCE